MARVVISTLARAGAADIFRDLTTNAGFQAVSNYAASFEELYDRLAIFPEAGALRPLLGRHARIGLVLPYVVLYRYSPSHDIVDIARIVHGSRRISRSLLRTK